MILQELGITSKDKADLIAIDTGKEQITYSQLLDKVDKYSYKLQKTMPQTPSRIVIGEGNPLSILIAVLACWNEGHIPVIARDSKNTASLKKIINHCQASLLIHSDGLIKHCDNSLQKKINPKESLIICTSGTTGTPRLVALPKTSVLLNTSTIGKLLNLKTSDKVAVITPLTYAYGLVGIVLTALSCGASCRLFPNETPITEMQSIIRKEALNILQGPPSLFRLFQSYWSGEAFPSVKVITLGGELMNTNLQKFLHEAFPNSYKHWIFGMTEAGPRISHQNLDDEGIFEGCIGQPFDYIDWRIEIIKQSGIPKNAGRLLLKGPSLCLGYLEANGHYKGLDKNGYFHSSDLVTTNSQGALMLLGRLDSMFKSGGNLLNPHEVEKVLLSHKSVKDAACIAEEHSVLGLIPVAKIVLEEDARIDANELSKYCITRLPQYAVPRKFSFLKQLPSANSGKRMKIH